MNTSTKYEIRNQNTKITMTKQTGKKQRSGRPRTRATTQSHLEKMNLSPPPKGKRYPRTNLIRFDGTKEQEIEVLRHLLPKDGTNPFKEPYTLDPVFAPRLGLNEAIYKNFFPLLYSMSDDLDTYIAIQDLLKATFRMSIIDTNIFNRREGEPETEGRYLYTPHLANYLLVAFKSNCTHEPPKGLESPKVIHEEEEEAEEAKEVEEEKVDGMEEEATTTPEMQDTKSYIQVLQGTPSSESSPINYEEILNNQYDPLIIDSFSDNSTPTNMNLDDNSTFSDVEEQSTVEADIEDHYQNQDQLQQEMGEESSLNDEAEAE